MRRAVLLLATMALAILLASGVAKAIINGQPDGNGHPYVGAVVTDFGGVNLPLCSGTLISPTVFLTVGHCTEILIEEDLPTYVSFDPTYLPGASELISGTPYTHPSYCDECGRPSIADDHPYDVGVVILDEPVEMVTYGRLPDANLVETLKKGTLLTAVGYGATEWTFGGGPPREVYTDVRNRATVKYLGTQGVANQLGENLFIKTSGASMGRGGEGACYGDSGGPYFLPDQKTVVTITSFGVPGVCAGPTYVQRVDLPVILDWVSSFR